MLAVVALAGGGLVVAPQAAQASTVVAAASPTQVNYVKPTSGGTNGKVTDTITIPNITGIQYTIASDKGTFTPAAGVHYITEFSDYPEWSARLSVTARPLSGYTMLVNGTPSKKKTYSVTFSGLTKVAAVKPTFTGKNGKANDVIVIPDIAGIQYKIGSDKKAAKVAAGTYKITKISNYPGYSADVTATLTPKEGYILTSGGKSVDSVTYTQTYSGLASVTTVAPSFSEADGSANDTFTIPSKKGVVYKVGNRTLAAGTYKVADYVAYSGGRATVTVTATPAEWYYFTSKSATSWTATFQANSQIAPAAPSFSDKAAEGSDTYTIPSQTGVNYYVNGSYKAPGTYTLSSYWDYTSNGNLQARTATINVEARAASSNIELTGTTTWTGNYTGAKETASTQPAYEAKYVSGTPKVVFTIPNIEGVQYAIDGVNVNPGINYATYGQTHKVTATAKSGYILTSTYNEWTVNSGGGGGGSTVVNPVKPTFADNTGKDNDTIVIPTVTGIQYKINGNTVAPGTYRVKDYAAYNNGIAEITILTEALSGYQISGTYTWWQQFSDSSYSGGESSGSQGTAVDTNQNPPTQWISGTNGYYSVPSVTGIDYYVDGVKTPAGTYTVTYAEMPKDITIVAQPQSGYSIKAGSNYQWGFRFMK